MYNSHIFSYAIWIFYLVFRRSLERFRNCTATMISPGPELKINCFLVECGRTNLPQNLHKISSLENVSSLKRSHSSIVSFNRWVNWGQESENNFLKARLESNRQGWKTGFIESGCWKGTQRLCGPSSYPMQKSQKRGSQYPLEYNTLKNWST